MSDGQDGIRILGKLSAPDVYDARACLYAHDQIYLYLMALRNPNTHNFSSHHKICILVSRICQHLKLPRIDPVRHTFDRIRWVRVFRLVCNSLRRRGHSLPYGASLPSGLI